MKLIEKIYENSPVLFQNIMATISGYQKNKSRYGKIYFEQLEFLKEFDKLNIESKKEFQFKELQKFLCFTQKNSAFYRELYQDINLESIKKIEDLKILPIIDKEMLRKNMENITTLDKKDAVVSNTGGTTGKSLEVLMTEEDMMKRMAMLDHFKSRVGFQNLKMKRASFTGKHLVPPKQIKQKFWRYNHASRQMLYSSFHLTEENLEYYVKSLNKFKPQALDGFPSSMVDVANYIDRHEIKLDFTPIAIFPTAETLTKSSRDLLERVFKCKVYNQYASSEGAPFITECKNNRLHVELSSGIFETVNETTHEALVTSFTTHGTPLIRYRIGDSIEFDNDKIVCKCGVNSEMVKSIQGREQDFLLTIDGGRINSGVVANLFKDMPNSLIRSQVLQTNLDEISILLQVDKSIYKSEHDNILRKNFSHTFGDQTKININHVKEINQEKSGKQKFIKNNIGEKGEFK